MFDWNLNHKADQTLAKEGKCLIGKGYLRNDNKRNKPKKKKQRQRQCESLMWQTKTTEGSNNATRKSARITNVTVNKSKGSAYH